MKTACSLVEETAYRLSLGKTTSFDDIRKQEGLTKDDTKYVSIYS